MSQISHIRVYIMDKRIISTLAMLLMVLTPAFAKERRVYYLDITGSMEKYGLWDDVRDNLIEAIEQIGNSKTELVVIPFTDEIKRRKTVTATERGKEELREFISSLSPQWDCGTTLSNVMEDFYANYMDAGTTTYMFLMTDGKEQGRKVREGELQEAISSWERRVPENHFGFFVMLHNAAYNENTEELIAEQEHLWCVKTADININIIEYESKAIYNVRNETSVTVRLNKGDISGMEITASLKENPYYELDHCRTLKDGIRISLKKKSSPVPEKYEAELEIACANLPEYNYLVTTSVSIECIDKKEKTLILKFK